MKRLVEFVVYLSGVVFLSWNYYKLKAALDVRSLFALVLFFLFGVFRFATWASDKAMSYTKYAEAFAYTSAMQIGAP